MENHHENPKPSNKWVATPIVAAFIFVSCVVFFLTMASGQCCGGNCDSKTKTEHSTEHNPALHEGNNDAKDDVVVNDSIGAANDSSIVENDHEEKESHKEH